MKGLTFMQINNTTFKPELQEVKNVKTTIIQDVYHVNAIRIDKRPTCCHNHKMQIKDYRTVNILLPSYQNKKVILHLKKQRYKCRHCNKTITSQIKDIEKNNIISNKVKQQIQEKLKEIKSYKQIAKEEKVSINTVIRIIDKIQINPKQDIDTSIIYIDEFKGNIEKEKYQLAMYDKNHSMVDILKNRNNQTIKQKIKQLEIKPQIIVMDMFAPFRNTINQILPQAQIVADKYHVIRQGVWTIRDLRVELFNKDEKKYKELKKYWKLLSKDPTSKFTKKQKKRLKQLLSLDEELKRLYTIIKEFYKMFKVKRHITLQTKIEQVIKKLIQLNIKQSIKLANTLINWKEEIINIIKHKINNGYVEGYNNKIKVIKRVSFGLRNYERFRKLMYLRLCQ